MSARKPKVATKKHMAKLDRLEGALHDQRERRIVAEQAVASLQAQLAECVSVRNAHFDDARKKQREIEELKNKLGAFEVEYEDLKGRCHKLELDLVYAAARIEVFEFLARLKHGAKGGSSTSGPVHPSLSNGVSPAYDAFRSPR